MRRTSSCRVPRVSASSAENGSSISMIFGSIESARAIPTRCFMPPESSAGRLCSAPVSPTADASLFTFLSHNVTSDDPNYNNLFVPNVFVHVGDVMPPMPPPIQTGGVEVSTNHLEVTPGGPAQTYTVVLTSQPTADVTITIAQGDIAIDPLVPVASAISIDDPGDQLDNEGDAVQLPIQATNSANAALTFSATGLPPGLAIDSQSGLISGTISASASANSPFTSIITATDGTHTDHLTVQWFVSIVFTYWTLRAWRESDKPIGLPL